MGIWRGRPPGAHAERLFLERAKADDEAEEAAAFARLAALDKAHPPRKFRLFPRRRKETDR